MSRRLELERPAGRRTGAVDVFDLCLGIGLTVMLPVVVWLTLHLLGLETRTEEEYYRQLGNPRYVRDLPPPPLDAEEVQLRLDHCRRMYAECVQPYLRRFRAAPQSAKPLERAWALESLSKLRAELSDLEADLRRGKAVDLFPAQLREIQKMLQDVEQGLGEVG